MSEILIGQFLFRRLKELGIETIFGVPGDFELALLDLIEPEGGLTWRGTPNELVGAYAADGYARVKGAGALITTFGPGELSALCGIGGSFCEFVPVVHIVGYPTSAAQASGNILHHTLGDKSYDHYIKMSSELSVATAALKDPATAPAEIDRVLNAMIHYSQPGYIGIPENIAYAKCSSSLLDKKLVRSLPAGAQDNEVVEEIVRRLESAKNPILMVDGGAARYSWEGYVGELVEALNIPHFVTTLGKGIVNEQHPLFGGAYAGLGSWQRVIQAVSTSDLIIWLGNLPSDFNTGMFTEHFNPAAIVDLRRFSAKIGETQYDAKINYVLPKLVSAVKSSSSWASRSKQLTLSPRDAPYTQVPTGLSAQDWFWERIGAFLQPGDAVVTETGTSQVGILGTTFQKGVWHWTQAVYGSIGYAAGAAVGASIASHETGKHRRLVLITGEGSLQLTVQAFSILIRHGIIPLVFVVNNFGYTVERYFCGMTAQYNDVPGWNYGNLFKAFAPKAETTTHTVTTGTELDRLLNDKAFQSATHAQLVDIHMDPEDLPKLLKGVFEMRDKRLAAAKAAEKK